MMLNPWYYDKADKVMLTAAMFKVLNDDLVEMSPGDWGYIEDTAEMATRLLPGYCDEGDDWDGVVWLEMLESSAEGSLAHELALLTAFSEGASSPEQLEDDVAKVLTKWLITQGRALRNHHGIDRQTFLNSNICPVCGHNDVQGEEVVIDRSMARQASHCPECNSTWTDLYTLTAREELCDERGTTEGE